ncbi:MAG TPA: TonB-dependent receptor [Oleiagrimonas sp.]|nr:TonB-dependent receptor [Oleiagrimonas sp.]
MYSHNALTKCIRRSLAVMALGACAVTMPAMAAGAGQAQQDQQDQNAEQLKTITVTGTLIRQSDVAPASPVTRVTHQQIEDSGFQDIGQLLNNLPSVGYSMGIQTGSFYGTGATRINLRYLGSNRLLVLLNGKRFVSSFGGSVDLTQIPLSIVDHIEILQDGASATYGADAIAGVVNIITKKNYNGATLSVQGGIAHGRETGKWDGKQQSVHFTFGRAGDWGHITFSGSERTVDAIPAYNRVFGDLNYRHPKLASVAGGSATPAGRFIFNPPSMGDPTTPTGASPAAYTGLTSAQCPNQLVTLANGTKYYLPHCDLTIKNGMAGDDPANYRPWVPTDNYYKGATNIPLTINQDIKSAYTEGSWNFSDNMSANFSALYTHRESKGPRSAGLIYYDNPGMFFPAAQNPFGFDIAYSDPITLAPGYEAPALEAIYKRTLGEGRRTRIHRSRTFRISAGLAGHFEMIGSRWDWNANYINAVNHVFSGQSNVPENLAIAMGTSPDCAARAQYGCVPLNPFAGAGRMTEEQAKFLGKGSVHVYSNDEKAYHSIAANISTADLFMLPAGGVGFALGYQKRTVSGTSTPGATSMIGTESGGQVLHGTYDVSSVFGEINVPILAQVPGAYALSVDLASRRSDYSTFGVTTNSKVGLRWQPIHDLLFRASWSEGFRAGNLSELFSPPSTGYPYVVDPCSNYTAAPANVQANCQAAGVPASYTQLNSQLTGTYGGNPNLDPETSVSKTAGFVYSPSFAPGLSLNVDYYHIKLENQISSVSAQLILNRCYKAGIQDYCSRITRTPSGNIQDMSIRTGNNGGVITSGIDFGGGYVFPMTSIGQFNIHLRSTHVNEYKVLSPQPDGSVIVSKVVGDLDQGAIPEWKAQLIVGWQKGPWNASVTGHYISDFTGTCSNGWARRGYPQYSLTTLGLCSNPNTADPSQSTNRRPSLIWWDVQGSYATSFGMDLQLGIRNAFGKLPAGNANGLGQVSSLDYGVFSQYFYGRITYHF